MPSTHCLPALSTLSHRLTESGIRRLEQAARHHPDLISLGPGQPDPSRFPLTEILAGLVARSQAAGAPERLLQYGPSQGDPELMGLIVAHMRKQGFNATPRTSWSPQGHSRDWISSRN